MLVGVPVFASLFDTVSEPVGAPVDVPVAASTAVPVTCMQSVPAKQGNERASRVHALCSGRVCQWSVPVDPPVGAAIAVPRDCMQTVPAKAQLC